jgi:hypothetical protein
MTKTLKIWGGATTNKQGKQVRAIVAAYTTKQGAEISGDSYNRFTHYWCETGNAQELSIATEVGMWLYTGSEFQPDTKIIRVK